jgi:hypothetical protein
MATQKQSLTKQSQFTPDSAPNPMPQQDLTQSSSPCLVPLCLCGEPLGHPVADHLASPRLDAAAKL